MIAGLDLRRLELCLGGRALDRGHRVLDQEVHGERQVERDDPVLEEHGPDLEVLEQVAGRVPDLGDVERRLLVAREVHEDEVVALAVEVLRLAVVHLRRGHRLAAPPGLRQRLARPQVLDLGLDEQAGAARGRRLRLHLGRLPGVAVDLQDVPAPQLRDVDDHAASSWPFYPRPRPRGNSEGRSGPLPGARLVIGTLDAALPRAEPWAHRHEEGPHGEPREPRQPGAWQEAVLVLLRMAIGWHFLYEGLVKVLTPGWTSAPFLAESRWLLSGAFHWIASHPVGPASRRPAERLGASS